MLFRISGVVALVAACGCSSTPPYHSLPQQRRAAASNRPRTLAERITMNQPFTNRHILSGVLDAEPSAPWRWAGKRAELQFEIPEIEGQKLFAHFAISGELLKSTGPVRMRFFVDNVEVGSARYAEEGEKQFETPVPPARLRAGEPIRVALEVDKTWTSPDGVVLGFLLIGAGFKN